MNRIFSITVLLLIPLFLSAAASDREQIKSVIEEAKLIHYSGNTAVAAKMVSLLDAMSVSLDTAAGALTGTDISIFKSEYLLYKGLLLVDLGDDEKASEVLFEGIKLCEMEYARGNDLFFLVQGALLKSHWMLLQRTSVLIKTGGEIQDMTNLALELDGADFTARLLSAQGLINAPPLFGGDPKEAARLLLASENLTADDYDRFDLYLTLADARRKKKEWEEAAQWCTEALVIFPENGKALEMEDLIRRKKK